MHATELIERCVRPACQSMHGHRYRALTTAVEGAVTGRCVTVTALGRALGKPGVQERHAIKRMDRLVGNQRLQDEAPMVYGAMTRWAIGGQARPLLVVDWSPLSSDGRWHVLRASTPAGGRALTVYQEVHPENRLGSRQVQLDFLDRLAALLPTPCRPIVVTDAGFKNPWFRAVEALGWDWIGRIRGAVQLSRPGEEDWLRVQLLGRVLETDKAIYMGTFELAASNRLRCHVYGLRKPPKGRFDKTRRGHRAAGGASRRDAARQREPWVLATNLQGGAEATRQVINSYRQRMEIEEAFRDTKSEYYGLGLARSKSRSAGRFTVLLLVNALAAFIAWLFGKVATRRELHRRYQANSIRHRPVLSAFFLGLRVLHQGGLTVTDADLHQLQAERAAGGFA